MLKLTLLGERLQKIITHTEVERVTIDQLSELLTSGTKDPGWTNSISAWLPFG